MPWSVISQELIRSILARYALPRDGIHGVSHWARVLENGRRLSEVTGARMDVLELEEECFTTETQRSAVATKRHCLSQSAQRSRRKIANIQ
jgi:hypothetical protein